MNDPDAAERERVIDEFHDAVDSRVEYVAEAIIGQHLLRDLVVSMRECCSKKDQPRAKWVKVFKEYRTVHALLVDRAKKGSSVKFLNI